MASEPAPTGNPLLSDAPLPPFSAIRPEHVGPAVDALLADYEAQHATLRIVELLGGLALAHQARGAAAEALQALEVRRLLNLGRATAEDLRVAGTVIDSVRDQLRLILRG